MYHMARDKIVIRTSITLEKQEFEDLRKAMKKEGITQMATFLAKLIRNYLYGRVAQP